MSVRVLIADDHPVVRDGLRLAIERSGEDVVIAGEASDGIEVLRGVGAGAPDVYILDLVMPGKNGLETARELFVKVPGARIILLSLHDTKSMIDAAFAAGALGYLTKEMASRSVVEAVLEVHAGRRFLCPRAAAVLGAGSAVRPPPGGGDSAPESTPQELRVLELIAGGRSNKEIAALLGASVHTIHSHRNHLMAKLDIHRHADLVRYAIKAGLIGL